jgi:spermidine synthase
METPDRTRTFLAVNGQIEGSTDKDGMVTQTVLAHLPLLLHPDPQDVLVIGLGTGITFAATLRYPVAKSVCIEISPEVVEASQVFASFWEGMSLEDERAEIIVGDARSYLFFSPRKFDVIIAQPSDVWVRGMGNLFSQEYFQAMRDRLNEGGVACQWLQGYGLSPRTFKSILRTYSSVFRHVSLWWPNITGGDFLLLGSEEAYRFRVEKLDTCVTKYGLRYYDRPEDDHMTPYTLLRRFVAADEVLRDFTADAPIVTDDSGFLEYAATRESYTSYLDVLHLELSRISHRPAGMIAVEEGRLQDVTEQLTFYDYNRSRFIEYIYTDPSPEPWASPTLRENENNWARDNDISPVLGRSLISFAERVYAESPYSPGTEEHARLAYRVFQGYMEAFKFTPPTELDFANVAQLYRDMGDLEGSLETANEALRRGFRSAAVYQIKGEVLYAIASRHLAEAQDADLASGDERASRMAEARRNLQEAFEAFNRAAEADPANPGHWLNMGVVQRMLGDSAAAREYWQKALEVDPGNETALQFLNTPER